MLLNVQTFPKESPCIWRLNILGKVLVHVFPPNYTYESYVAPTLPHDLSGKTFTHIFGTQTSAREFFILKSKLKGPSWLKLKHVRQTKTKVCFPSACCNLVSPLPLHCWWHHPFCFQFSFCKFEGEIDNPEYVSVLQNEGGRANPAPPLVMMALKVKTNRNQSSGKNEIVAATAVVHSQGRFTPFQLWRNLIVNTKLNSIFFFFFPSKCGQCHT